MTYDEHDMSYPTYHNPVMPEDYLSWTADDELYKITKEPVMYWHNGDESGAFVCYFKIIAPDNVTWKPVFMSSTSDYKIMVYKEVADGYTDCVYDTEDPDYAEPGACANDKWFKIVVFPYSDNAKVGNTVDFGIVYNQSWTESYINLYINGEYGNIKWPSSGDNPKLISIRHIDSPN